MKAPSAEDRIDVPDAETAGVTVVGIGTSAGGLDALKRLFTAMPDGTGLAFVVIVHISADHESRLAELLQPCTSMPVAQVSEPVDVRPDHVYVIPPGHHLASSGARVQRSSPGSSTARHAPIDHFFATLAELHTAPPIGIVLTGTGSDGALGLRAIKEHGGLTIAQDPTEAEHDGMPRAAIATGMVDLVARIEQMPDAIVDFARTAVVPQAAAKATATGGTEVVTDILADVRAEVGRDYSAYKLPTILRRIARRMRLARLSDLEEYRSLLRRDPDELRALADDFLITVTEFFRDPAVFVELERHVIPEIFAGKGPADQVRVWSVGCSTGEEAYSIAMVLHEHASKVASPPRIQVFASDVHHLSLQRARDGRYPAAIAANVSPERLGRFFEREGDTYVVRRELRESIVFSGHDLLRDPPFSKLDLVVCRNVLIYFVREAQRQVMNVFQYALRSGGFLLLGSAETVEAPSALTGFGTTSGLYRMRVEAARSRVPALPKNVATRPPADASAADEPAMDADRNGLGDHPTLAEYAAHAHELGASNEELSSLNEELRATLEELETSKEELQSVNEELQTVNEENQHKVEELARLSSDLSMLMGATEIAMLFLDGALRIARFTPKVGGLLSVRPGDEGRPLSDLTHRFTTGSLYEDAARALRSNVPIARDLVTDDGTWYLVRTLPYRAGSGAVRGVAITFVDITAQKEVEEQLTTANARLEALSTTLRAKNDELAAYGASVASSLDEAQASRIELLAKVHHDPLTGLPNRVLLEDRLAVAVASAARHERLLCVLFIDLDDFKAINDTFGHAVGDAVLIEAARRMRAAVREADTLARLHGDEFAVVAPDLRDRSDAELLARSLLAMLDRPYDALPKGTEPVGASIGISVYPDDGADSRSLLRAADDAMYRVKRSSRGGGVAFETVPGDGA